MSNSRTLAEVLRRYRDGPQTGVFTDGGARPNPGPGGWGVVYVRDGAVVAHEYGSSPDTTNNRMELTALINGYKLIGPDNAITMFSDSDLCVKSMNEWAHTWARNGWKKKTGPIKNLELVQELFALYKAHPLVKLEWIKAHNGWLWNEYADSLASAWERDEL